MVKLGRLAGGLLIVAGLYSLSVTAVDFANARKYEVTDGSSTMRQGRTLGEERLETLVDAPPSSGDERPGIYNMTITIEGPPGIDAGDVEVRIEEIQQSRRPDYVRAGMVNTGMGLFAIAYGGILIYLNRNRSTNGQSLDIQQNL